MSARKPVVYVTFGQRYRHERHPTLPEAHPDGWLEIRGLPYSLARAVAQGLTDGAFAFDYVGDDFDPKWHPRGAFLVIEATRPDSTEGAAA